MPLWFLCTISLLIVLDATLLRHLEPSTHYQHPAYAAFSTNSRQSISGSLCQRASRRADGEMLTRMSAIVKCCRCKCKAVVGLWLCHLPLQCPRKTTSVKLCPKNPYPKELYFRRSHSEHTRSHHKNSATHNVWSRALALLISYICISRGCRSNQVEHCVTEAHASFTNIVTAAACPPLKPNPPSKLTVKAQFFWEQEARVSEQTTKYALYYKATDNAESSIKLQKFLLRFAVFSA